MKSCHTHVVVLIQNKSVLLQHLLDLINPTVLHIYEELLCILAPKERHFWKHILFHKLARIQIHILKQLYAVKNFVFETTFKNAMLILDHNFFDTHDRFLN